MTISPNLYPRSRMKFPTFKSLDSMEGRKSVQTLGKKLPCCIFDFSIERVWSAALFRDSWHLFNYMENWLEKWEVKITSKRSPRNISLTWLTVQMSKVACKTGEKFEKLDILGTNTFTFTIPSPSPPPFCFERRLCWSDVSSIITVLLYKHQTNNLKVSSFFVNNASSKVHDFLLVHIFCKMSILSRL